MTDTSARASGAAGNPPQESDMVGDMAGEPMTDAMSDAMADPVAALQQEAADLKDRLLRTLAEMENLRRRTEREVADARAYAIAGFARDLLGVADNMRRALDAATKDSADAEAGNAGLKALIEGVELTERELLKVLERHGVKQIEPLGQKFDPNLQQAMFEVPDPSVPAGTVVQVMQSGYTIGERILRPALVGVAKGGPKATGDGAANDNAGAGGANEADPSI